MRWGKAALGTCVVMIAAGCTAPEGSGRAGGGGPVAASSSVGVVVTDSATPAGIAELLPCAASIGGRPGPPVSYRVVVENVGVPTEQVLQVSASGETDPAVGLFAKWGLEVRAGVAVDLQVAPGWEDRARIGWGNPGSPGVAVHVPACAGSSEAPWLAFAGGTWVRQPACVPLIVRSQGREAQVRLGVGVPCASAGSS